MIPFWVVNFRFWISATRSFGFILAALLLTLSGPTAAQQQPKLAKIGELLFRDRTNLGAGRQVFRDQLRELGYVEGKNVIYETRPRKGNWNDFPHWPKSWSDSRLTCLSPPRLLKRWRLRMRQR
jgi:hypothetical protein